MKTSERSADVKMWLAHPLARDVKAAIERLAATDDAVRIAVMPDVHLAHEVCVGTVLATRRFIYPGAIGGDIGCGMAAIAFDADAERVRGEIDAARILSKLQQVAPAMRHSSRDAAPDFGEELGAMPLSDARLESIRRRDGVVQLGTLGRGNHFLEFQADDEDRLWLMVHTGSRAMGPAIRDFHLQHAQTSRKGLQFINSEAQEGRAFLADVEWARIYARQNRRAIVDATIDLMRRLFHVAPIEKSRFDCDHNHVSRETHFGQELWIHRKGASSARDGEAGMIPGSMGTQSFHVEGRGCAEAICSSSHGAGRAMSRAEAQRKISTRAVGRQLHNIWYDRRIEGALREEAPSAYKDIRAVMRAQRDLTRITRRLRPLISYKAS